MSLLWLVFVERERSFLRCESDLSHIKNETWLRQAIMLVIDMMKGTGERHNLLEDLPKHSGGSSPRCLTQWSGVRGSIFISSKFSYDTALRHRKHLENYSCKESSPQIQSRKSFIQRRIKIWKRHHH